MSVFPEFRGRGVSTELIRAVLDDVRAQGKRITNYCPVVNTFIEQNPSYADLMDPENLAGSRKAASCDVQRGWSVG